MLQLVSEMGYYKWSQMWDVTTGVGNRILQLVAEMGCYNWWQQWDGDASCNIFIKNNYMYYMQGRPNTTQN